MITYQNGSVEYLNVTVVADVELTTQAVSISVDSGGTWLAGGWQGPSEVSVDGGTTWTTLTGEPPAEALFRRRARTDDVHTFDSAKRYGKLLVRLTDLPEAPILYVDDIEVD